MRNWIVSILLVSFAPMLWAANTSADDAAIRARIKTHETASRLTDFKAMAAGFTADGDVIVRDRARWMPSDPARASIAPASQLPERVVTMSVHSIRYVTPDVAIAESINAFNTGDLSKFRATWVLVRKDGQWLISAFRVLPAEAKTN